MYLLQLGVISSLLSDTLVSGFTTAAAVQVKFIFIIIFFLNRLNIYINIYFLSTRFLHHK